MIQREEMSFNEKQPITLRHSVDEEQKVRVIKVRKGNEMQKRMMEARLCLYQGVMFKILFFSLQAMETH